MCAFFLLFLHGLSKLCVFYNLLRRCFRRVTSQKVCLGSLHDHPTNVSSSNTFFKKPPNLPKSPCRSEAEYSLP
ncbi:hypothetical protein V8C43DRAFT_284562 [Trichoderma afarasin]